MAIEINEMVIQASTGEETFGRNGQPVQEPPVPDMAALKEKILAECREMILDILDARGER